MTLRRANAVIALALLFCLCGCTKDYEPQSQAQPSTGVRSSQDSTHTEGITITIDTTWNDTVNIEF